MRDIIAGISFKTVFDAELSADQSVSHLYLNGKADTYHIIGGVDDGRHQISINPSISQDWVAGLYQYSLVLKNNDDADDVRLIEGGKIMIKDNPMMLGTGDYRSNDEITLENINAVLENKASFEQKEYKIGNRELQRFHPKELLELKEKYEKRIRAALAKQRRISSGKKRKLFKFIPIRFRA